MKNVRRQIPVRTYRREKDADARVKELNDLGLEAEKGLITVGPGKGRWEVGPKMVEKKGRTKLVWREK